MHYVNGRKEGGKVGTKEWEGVENLLKMPLARLLLYVCDVSTNGYDKKLLRCKVWMIVIIVIDDSVAVSVVR